MTHPLQSRIHNRWNCLHWVWQDWSCDQSVVGRRGRLGPSRGKDWLLMKAEEEVSLCSVVCVPTGKPTRLQGLVTHLWSCGWLWINSESQSRMKHMSGRKGLLGRGRKGWETDERRWTENNQNVLSVRWSCPTTNLIWKSHPENKRQKWEQQTHWY